MGFKVAVVGVVWRTNAGKSTLVNALVGEKVSIVSPVEQTTRNTIRGIVADPRGQLVLLDTPGRHKAVGGLGRILNRMARRSAAGTDVTCVVFDASQEPQLEDVGWMQRVARERPEKVVFVLKNLVGDRPRETQQFQGVLNGCHQQLVTFVRYLVNPWTGRTDRPSPRSLPLVLW